ncbi:sugar porter family MFS transporter [Colletotrichum abscissum]|uniref:Sugar porter family MFS transporter n=1 Tax=Colletotrichum tamarilloi TaxID=1209934 RepID=A0ABQ9R3F7_9PEZI|nr:sugar porter family MFS transporter [Colletotrichum tamarilloi]XP_060392344.1 sugar porter family MFS transporter [Colletotrichum abscissum]KAK1477746.1 sugar porter family MFS transporter [Colletotrichum abscissum]KAK1493814.1 sugar porter family MFS transporter [Colletotrichum tamarilloi]
MSPPYSRSSARAAAQDDEIQPLLRRVDSSSYSDTSAMASKDAETIVVAPNAKPGADDAALAEAIRLEHNLTFSQAVKLYPAAIGWSAFVSIGVIMLAFDPQLLGNLYATPQFQRDFGYEYEGSYIITAAWQTGLSMGNPVGQVVGALFAAYPMDWYGRKLTFAVCVILTAGIVFIQFFARSLPVLLVGELLGGLVLGMYVVIAPAYASEVCPTAIRGHLTSYVNLCFVMGQLLANGVTAGTSKLDTHWAYSLPFALQWFWILVILPGLLFVPESPWWLVRKGRMDDARKSLGRLASKQVNVDASLAFIVETDRLEQELEAGSTYYDCLKGANLRRTEISVGVYCTQVLSGIYLINYGTYFFQQAGLPTDKAFDMAIGFLAVGFLGTVISWYFLIHYGRRTIYITGLAALVFLQLLIGILDCVPGRPSGVAWAESSLMLIWNFAYDLSVGPVCFVLISEASATRVRSKTIALATAAQGVLGIIMTVAIPYMINPDEANMQGKLGFFFGGLAGLCFIWAWFRVPETMGRTYEELDILFDRRIPARDFKGYVVDGISSADH